MIKEEIIQLINNQKNNLINSPFKVPANRIKSLKLLKKNIIEMVAEIADALKKDLNKSTEESYMCEIGLVLSEISYMIKHIKKFAKPKRVRTPLSQFPSKSFKLPCAYGSVLIISPWNYPFMLSIEPMVDAIAAGNSVVLKPSQTSNNVQKVIEKLINKTFNKEQVFVVMGGREECDFLLDQDFDYMFFTGSTRVGKTVMQKASEKFIPVTLELGGKSPCVVDETANIELSAKRIVFGKLLNAGQTCVAPDYIYCHKSVKEKLIKELKKQIILQYGVDPLNNDNYPKVINKKQFDFHISLLNNSNIIFGGKTDETKLKIEPTIVLANFEDTVMESEIFGPILPIVTFENLDQAITKLNSFNKPLAFYIFSSSKTNQNKLLKSCDFGGGCINDTVIHLATPLLGFGGLKQSGIGAYHGKVGFDSFSHYKSIVNKKTWLDLPMRYQPINKFKNFLIRMFLK